MSDSKPIIVQSDLSILLEVQNVFYEEARDVLCSFAELVKSPEYIHTYKISPISLWNAASAGLSSDEVVKNLKSYSRYDVPSNVISQIKTVMSRYGAAVLTKHDDDILYLKVNDPDLYFEADKSKVCNKYFIDKDNNGFFIKMVDRGNVKIAFIDLGYPVEDVAGYYEGEYVDLSLRDTTLSGNEFVLRGYQKEATEVFYQNGTPSGGNGVVVLPCGSGKTIVGLNAIALAKTKTLILSTHIASLHQWRRELIDKMNIDEDLIGEYSGDRKEIKPVTICTYQILVHRRSKDAPFAHFDLFKNGKWGLIIYDEVHLLPAPIFRVTAEIQSTRRLGLTATLVREDGREKDVFALIGPKRYDIPWKVLERKGFIAKGICKESRVPLNDDDRRKYIISDKRNKFRIASENELKDEVVREIISKHKNDSILVIGQYISQLKRIAKKLGAPLITGQVNNNKREELYSKFREGEVKVIVVSKVANFAIDLPDASVAIQISGTFGSKQEEAQRLGRILRPKEKAAYFYSVVTKNSKEHDFAMNRQLFLTEQGYEYFIEDYE
jgi:DNA excision repair protein ERCC-3